ncbi:MAG: hypothetical protein CMP48_23860 [Rickettsiales bacterium]|nr:hypothetical protein [Rickettsiales bacterium]
MTKKIIVLGAGASIGSKRFPIKSSFDQFRTTMPSAENFFYDLSKVNNPDQPHLSSLNFLGLMYEGLNELITRAWNIEGNGSNNEGWKGVNIEEVMTFLEVGLNMSAPDSNEQKMYINAQESLIDYLYPTIPMVCRDQHCEYLMKIFWKLDDTDSIISYNWDTIADFTLETCSTARRGKLPQLRNYAKLLRDKSISINNYLNKGLLLKLHGSFNWMNCKNPKCENSKKIIPPFHPTRQKYKLLTLHETWTCPLCGGKHLEPHIIPPLSNKTIHKNSFLRDQWMIARQKLLKVEELIFIGYSFPPTDYYTEWLFRQLNFIENKEPIKITVVNPEYKKRNSLVAKRYKTIFKGCSIESFLTLKDYVSNYPE